MTGPNFISQQDALDLIGRSDVSFVDGSWYLPAQKRDGEKEFQAMRLPGAVYFDINKIAAPDTELPHMLPDPADFAKAVSLMGISHDNLIVVYDGPGLFSAARVWWTFRIMGALDVRILEGGMDGWKAAELPVETGHHNPPRAKIFQTNFNPDMIASKADLEGNLETGAAVVLDARSQDRFLGLAAEPRAGLRSGHIPASRNLPFGQLMKDGKLLDAQSLDEVFTNMGIAKDQKVITSCGSGVTAAILSLALYQSGRDRHSLYDGSWAEWGMPDGPPIKTDDE